MKNKDRNKLLSKYINEFQQHLIEEERNVRDTHKSKKVYRKLETKDDVMKILSETYLKEYKETEKKLTDSQRANKKLGAIERAKSRGRDIKLTPEKIS